MRTMRRASIDAIALDTQQTRAGDQPLRGAARGEALALVEQQSQVRLGPRPGPARAGGHAAWLVARAARLPARGLGAAADRRHRGACATAHPGARHRRRLRPDETRERDDALPPSARPLDQADRSSARHLAVHGAGALHRDLREDRRSKPTRARRQGVQPGCSVTSSRLTSTAVLRGTTARPRASRCAFVNAAPNSWISYE